MANFKLDEPLSNLNLADRYQKLLRRIHSSDELDVPETVNGIMNLKPEIFEAVEGIGATYVKHLADLQQELTTIFNLNKTNLDTVETEKSPSVSLSNLFLNHVFLNKEEIKLICKLETQKNIKDINLQFLLNFDQNKFSKYYGSIFHTFIKLREKIKKELGQEPYPKIVDISEHRLFVSSEIQYFDVTLIDSILSEDVSTYLRTLNEQQIDIALSRWGYNRNYETLEEIGRRYSKTRERIRQLEKKINTLLQANLRIHPEVLLVNIRHNLTSDLTTLFPKLLQQFGKADLLYRFLEICCGSEKGSIRQPPPKFNPNILFDFFSKTSSPTSYEKVLAELMLSYNKMQAKIIIKKLGELKKIQILEDTIIPKNMDKNSAIAHVLTNYPAGLPWKDISKIINSNGYSHANHSEIRLEINLDRARLVYLYGRGIYRHIKFVDTKQVNIEKTIINILFYFNEQKINNIHLHDYYDQIKNEINYYDLRYIIKNYGEEHGLYFTGNSSVDNVSLDPNNKKAWITQKDIIVKIFKSNPNAMTMQQISEQIRSKSINHARLYVKYLREEGKIVRVDKMMYTTPQNAFKDMDKTAVMQVISDILHVSNRIVEADIFREVVNQKLDLNYSKYFYSSLIKTQAPNWYCKQNLFSIKPIPYKNLTDVCNLQCQPSLSNKENITRIREIIYLTNSVAHNMIYQWKMSKN